MTITSLHAEWAPPGAEEAVSGAGQLSRLSRPDLRVPGVPGLLPINPPEAGEAGRCHGKR
ncbi:hypothetical protein GCM10011374_31950 [Kocuria dechangensis]|uniref:Uncharacterized protein n=1 Tax=Kocuria dechangensis TaxID=1176249 RepID=A0A917LXL0_9MICC|nr:hypothetical protein GCM10011374_31950 [Kocuria dechangensis]